MMAVSQDQAVAGHRQTHGAVLDNIDTLVPGDRIYVQTREGYYVYRYRSSDIVLPSATEVLLPVPAQPAATRRLRPGGHRAGVALDLADPT